MNSGLIAPLGHSVTGPGTLVLGGLRKVLVREGWENLTAPLGAPHTRCSAGLIPKGPTRSYPEPSALCTSALHPAPWPAAALQGRPVRMVWK